jgi:hypothetical protein
MQSSSQREEQMTKIKKSPGTVVHSYNHSFSGMIWRILVQGQPREKLAESISNNKQGVVAHTCHPSYVEA